jgi:uncharacterized protein (TIGR02301 family)
MQSREAVAARTQRRGLRCTDAPIMIWPGKVRNCRVVIGKMGRLGAVFLLAFVLAGAGAALPQEAVVPPAPNQPAYDPQLLRLSEILGAVHYLRRLCAASEGNLWRNEMQALIDAENPDTDRRARLVDRFNRGFQGFRSVYRTCTPAAIVAIDRYMEEGAKIARDITARYGKS